MHRLPFGLTRRPFRPAPTPEAYFPATGHEAAVELIRSAHGRGEGVAVLTGEPGTGKTLLAMRLLSQIGANDLPVYIPAARLFRRADLFQSILFDLNQPYRGLTDNELRLGVTEQAFAALAAGKRLIVILDEAHHLSADLLEEVRLLDNLDGRGVKSAFTLLVGLPSLHETLSDARLAGLRQRVGASATATAFVQAEAAAYLHREFGRCGGKPGVFTDDAVECLTAAAAGIPRVLNRLAGLAVELAGAGEADSVDVEAAGEAVERLGLSAQPSPSVFPEGSAGQDDSELPFGGEPAAAPPPKTKAPRRRAG